MNYNTFLSMFGLDSNNFKPISADPFYSEDDNSLTFIVEQRDDVGRICPHCNSSNVIIKDHDDVVQNITTNSNQKIELLIHKVRFKCKECKRTFTPALKNISSHSNISNHVKKLILLDTAYPISFSYIAKKYDVSVGTVISLFDEYNVNVSRLELPRILCIDEFHFSKIYDQNYCCVITDLENKTIVDIIKNRKGAYLDEYFSSISEEEREKVEYFISDMYDEYRTIRKKFFKNAIHIIDRFHIVTQLTVAINKRRNKVIKELNKKNEHPILANFMKVNWELFEQRRTKIPNKTYTNKKTGMTYSYEYLLLESLKIDHDLNLAYEVLQDILIKSYTISDNELESFFIRLSEKLSNAFDDDIKKVGRTIKKWIKEIMNAYTTLAIKEKYTNAIAENMNNHIKTLIKISYGLKDFERMRKRVLLMFKNKKKKKDF